MTNCTDCTPCTPVYSDTVCPDGGNLRCFFYSGANLPVLNISNADNGDVVIKKLYDAIVALSARIDVIENQ